MPKLEGIKRVLVIGSVRSLSDRLLSLIMPERRRAAL